VGAAQINDNFTRMEKVEDTKYWLWLTMVFGIGSRRIWEAMSLFSSAREAYDVLTGDRSKLRLNDKETENIAGTDISAAEQIIESCAEKNISVIGYDSADYPPQLRHIAVPPAVLYYKGSISCLKGTRTVTAVGTRKASPYGLRVTARICSELAQNGVIIVSGFALGTDITSQIAAADMGRPTACVLGCGIDVDYPRGNIRFRDHILETGGVFISEYPPGTPPHSRNFPNRNRILAALGRAAVVFEASQKSGSLITANMASDQGREVFCLPPADIMSEAWSGNCHLLRNGAVPLLSSQDILDCFRIGGSNDKEIRREAAESFGMPKPVISDSREMLSELFAELDVSIGAADIEAPVKSVKVPVKKAQKSSEPAKLPVGLTDIQKKIAEMLTDGPVHADMIAQKLGMDAAVLMTELTELEIMGAVTSLPGKMFEICR